MARITEYMKRMEILEKHLGVAFYKIGELHNKIDNAILEIIGAQKAGQVEAEVGDDFCGDCGRKFFKGDEKIIGGGSAKYGSYYKSENKPICKLCVDRRYEQSIVEYESKNSR